MGDEAGRLLGKRWGQSARSPAAWRSGQASVHSRKTREMSSWGLWAETPTHNHSSYKFTT